MGHPEILANRRFHVIKILCKKDWRPFMKTITLKEQSKISLSSFHGSRRDLPDAPRPRGADVPTFLPGLRSGPEEKAGRPPPPVASSSRLDFGNAIPVAFTHPQTGGGPLRWKRLHPDV
jgi:hypothetical protein